MNTNRGYDVVWYRSGRFAFEFRDSKPTGNYFVMTWSQVTLCNVLWAIMRVSLLRSAGIWLWSKIRVTHHYRIDNMPDLGGFTLERRPN